MDVTVNIQLLQAQCLPRARDKGHLHNLKCFMYGNAPRTAERSTYLAGVHSAFCLTLYTFISKGIASGIASVFFTLRMCVWSLVTERINPAFVRVFSIRLAFLGNS